MTGDVSGRPVDTLSSIFSHCMFSTKLFFDPYRAPLTLFHMAHYLGYLSFQCSPENVREDVMVASNDAMRERFLVPLRRRPTQ